jgi:Tyrosine phosphatase family
VIVGLLRNETPLWFDDAVAHLRTGFGATASRPARKRANLFLKAPPHLGEVPLAVGVVTGDSRSGDPARLTPAGWAALRGHGIRTIVDLRNDDERDPAPDPPPQRGIEVARAAGRCRRYRVLALRDWAGAHRVGPGPGASLARRGTSAREVIVTTLAAVDVEARLLAAGLTGGQLRVVRDRLLEPSS